MKKLILASVMMMGFISFSFAQTSVTKTSKPVAKAAIKKTTTTTLVQATTPPVKTTPGKINTAATAKTTDKNVAVLKKDGTPDKRYTAKSKTALKKDDTPDKRFKENKKS